MRPLTLLLSLTSLLSACSLTPPLQRPTSPIPTQFPAYSPAHAPTQGGPRIEPTAPFPLPSAAQLDWRALLGDPRLQRLIELALEHNRDLRLAVLNVQAVQAQYRIQRADRLPGVAAEATASRERTAAAGNAAKTPTEVSKQIGLGVGISAFELDLFGRVRALSEAAMARHLASEHGREAAQIALVGAVADAHFAQQLADEQRQLAEQTLRDWRQTLKLARLLKQADQSSGLDVAQAEGQVASAEADLLARERALARAAHALQLLVGIELPDGLADPKPLAQTSIGVDLPPGLPSDLLLTRPDLRQAEQMLVAANADIGAARAAFFPRISLTASLGLASTSLSALFDPSTTVWRFAPQITQPLFQGGRLRAELQLAEVRQSEAVTQYERAIQVAFREVADALSDSATYGRQIEAQSRAVASAQRRLDLSELRYRAGLDGRLELLDAQRQLYAAQQTLLELRHARIGNAVALYKALGGGLRG